VDEEKRAIYLPCVPYLLDIYKLKSIDVSGAFIGARGTVTRGLIELFRKLNLNRSLLNDIVLSVTKDSCRIIHHHLYSK